MFPEIVALFPKETVNQAETKRQNRIIKQMRGSPILRKISITLILLTISCVFTFVYISVGR